MSTITHDGRRLSTPRASRLTPHASRLTPHASRLTPHASRLTPRASRLALTVFTLTTLFTFHETRAATVTCTDNCACNCQCAAGQAVPLTTYEIIRPEIVKWNTTSIGVIDDLTTVPSWWTADPSGAVSYWNETDLTVSAGGTGVVIVYVSKKSGDNSWDQVIGTVQDSGGETNGMTIQTAAVAHVSFANNDILSVIVYVNCAYVSQQTWANIDKFHMYVHEIGHGLGLDDVTHVGSSTYDQCSVMTPQFTTIDTQVRTLDKKAVACLYGTDGNDLWSADPFVAASTACGFDTDARLASVRIEGNELFWEVEAETLTAGYEVSIALDSHGKDWRRVAVSPAGIGEHRVTIGDRWQWVRLSEVSTVGPTIPLAVKRRYPAQPPSLKDPPVRSVSSAATVEASAGRPRRTTSTSPEVVILTVPSLDLGPAYPVLQVANYWESQGYNVRAIEYLAEPDAFWNRRDAGDLIRTYATLHGTRYFHLIGDHEHIAGTYDDTQGNHPARDPEITYLVSTDQELADIDYDGRPDVVVTRWPVNGSADARCSYERMIAHDQSVRSFAQPHTGLMLVDDEDNVMNGLQGYVTHGMANSLQSRIAQKAIWQQTYRLDSSEYPDGDDRNAATADIINDTQPSLVVMLATGSDAQWPGGFFQTHPYFAETPWTNQWLSHDVPIVLTPACGSVKFTEWLVGELGDDAVCEMFFGGSDLTGTGCDAGSVAWIGAQSLSVDQPINWAFNAALIDELYEHPGRPVGDAYLAALNRLYSHFPEPADVAVINRMTMLGNPLSLFQRVPVHTIDAYVRKAGTTEPLLPMPENPAVGCPAGDADNIVLRIKLDAADVPLPLYATAITVSQPTSPETAIFPDYAPIYADGSPQWCAPDAQFPNGCYTTTVTIGSFGGCGIDSLQVSLLGRPLGWAPVNIKSPDMVIDPAVGPTRGKVETADFATFAMHCPSSSCDCVYSKPYSSCADFVPPDTTVGTGTDFPFFGLHYDHGDPAGGGNPSLIQVAGSAGGVRLEFAEEQPLIGQRTLRATVVLEGVEPFRAAVLALANGNPRLEYVSWTPDPSFSGQTMCADLVRGGQKQVFLGVLGSKNATGGTSTLGTAEFLVSSDDPLILTEEDFALVTADILEIGGQVRCVSPGNRQATFTPPSYRNELAQNYPNPFNPATTIAFSLAKAGEAELRIYDVRGALVRTLVKGRRDAGVHRVDWNGRNDRGQPVVSGVYFYKLVAGSFTDTKRMTTLK